MPVPAWTDTFVDTDDIHSVEFRQMFVDHLIAVVSASGSETSTTAFHCLLPRGGTFLHADIYYQVSAIMQDGETARSAEASVVTPSDGYTHGVNLAWDAVANAVSYRIYRRFGGAIGFDATPIQEIVRVRGGTTSWRDNGANWTLPVPDQSGIPPASPPSATSAPTGLTATATGGTLGYLVQIGEDAQQASGEILYVSSFYFSLTSATAMQSYLLICLPLMSDTPGGTPLIDPYGDAPPHRIGTLIGSTLWRRRRPRKIYDTASTASNTEFHFIRNVGSPGADGWLGPVMPTVYPSGSAPAFTVPVDGMIAELYDTPIASYPSGYGSGVAFVFYPAAIGQGGGGPPVSYRGLARFTSDGMGGGTWVLLSDADQLTHRADILDSENTSSGPNFTPPDVMKNGDFIGPWLFNQIRDVIAQMLYLGNFP